MLRVGLTGGIGSGKSTAAQRLVEHGAVLVDSDVLARAAVAAGSEGLAAIVGAFGEQVLGSGGELDRPALASVVFGDPAARERLNAIVHPLVRARSEELIAAAPPDAIVVQDVPLLVEGGMAPSFPLVVVVHADVDDRVRRLVQHRGMGVADARARIAAQADDSARRAAADVWLDNSGSPEGLVAAVDELWDGRLVPFEQNLRHRRAARPGPARPEADVAAHAARLTARVALAAGERGRGVAHVGVTAVPGLPATAAIDLQLGVDALADADAVRGSLEEIGFARVEDGPDERLHGSADPGRPAFLHVREVGSPSWRAALLERDWLRADGAARSGYRAGAGDGAGPGAEAWAVASGWSPSVG